MVKTKEQLNDVTIFQFHHSSYQILVQWVNSASEAQEEVDPIRSEPDAVQNQLEVHKV